MILKKMILTNFRQFEGTQQVIFSTDKEKNITVILGDNTYGKTTILQAILWCLYGTASFSNERTKDPLIASINVYENNRSLSKSMTASVELQLDHKEKQYTIKREIFFFF